MRLIVIFDLPTQTELDKKSYVKFRNFLINNGFDMIQYSVYIKICRNREQVNKFEKILNDNVPKKGNVRSLVITEKQYNDMSIFIGSRNSQEIFVTEEQLMIF